MNLTYLRSKIISFMKEFRKNIFKLTTIKYDSMMKNDNTSFKYQF